MLLHINGGLVHMLKWMHDINTQYYLWYWIIYMIDFQTCFGINWMLILGGYHNTRVSFYTRVPIFSQCPPNTILILWNFHLSMKALAWYIGPIDIKIKKVAWNTHIALLKYTQKIPNQYDISPTLVSLLSWDPLVELHAIPTSIMPKIRP